MTTVLVTTARSILHYENHDMYPADQFKAGININPLADQSHQGFDITSTTKTQHLRHDEDDGEDDTRRRMVALSTMKNSTWKTTVRDEYE